jgi:hypothetical protein
MTILGKMMAIFVLILSIMQGALTVMLFVSRSHWANQSKQLQGNMAVADAATRQYQADLEKAIKDGNDRVAAAEAKSNQYLKERDAQVVLRTATENELAAKKVELAAQTALVTKAQSDVQLRQADNERTLAVVKERDQQISDLVVANKKEREDRVTAEINLRVVTSLNVKLEEQLRGAMKQIVKATSPATTSSLKPYAENPPLENMEGLVSETDPSGLVKLTLGSDAGLKEGNTLQVFRIAENPSQSQYLGVVRIRSVTATNSVAEPLGKMSAPMKRGDYVSSRITGG